MNWYRMPWYQMPWYRKLRKWMGRYVPDPASGVGFGRGGEMDAGEVPLELDVEGRKGTVYLSQGMWIAIGLQAGWITDEAAEDFWAREDMK